MMNLIITCPPKFLKKKDSVSPPLAKIEGKGLQTTPSAPFLKHGKSGHLICYRIGQIYLLLTDTQNPLDTQNPSPYTPTMKKQCLINYQYLSIINFTLPDGKFIKSKTICLIIFKNLDLD